MLGSGDSVFGVPSRGEEHLQPHWADLAPQTYADAPEQVRACLLWTLICLCMQPCLPNCSVKWIWSIERKRKNWIKKEIKWFEEDRVRHGGLPGHPHILLTYGLSSRVRGQLKHMRMEGPVEWCFFFSLMPGMSARLYEGSLRGIVVVALTPRSSWRMGWWFVSFSRCELQVVFPSCTFRVIPMYLVVTFFFALYCTGFCVCCFTLRLNWCSNNFVLSLEAHVITMVDSWSIEPILLKNTIRQLNSSSLMPCEEIIVQWVACLVTCQQHAVESKCQAYASKIGEYNPNY